MLAFADGFTLIVAVTDSLEAQNEIQRRLWREGIRYQKAWVKDPDRPLLDQVEEHLRFRKMPVMMMGLERLSTLEGEVESALRHINWTRPQWVERIPQPVVFWVTPEFETLLAREAPDMWRFRSLVVEFKLGTEPGGTREAELRRRLRRLDLLPRLRFFYLLELARHRNDPELAVELVRLSVINDLPLPVQEPILAGIQHLSLPSQVKTPGLVRLRNVPNLLLLDLSFTQTTDENLVCLEELSNLTTLVLRGTEITDNGLKYLQLSKSIIYIYLGGTQITNEGWSHLQKLVWIKGLDLSHTLMTGSGLTNLRRFPFMEELFLMEMKMKDEDLASLEGLQFLKSLHLDNAEISDSVLPILARLRNLTNLSLFGTPITEQGLKQLRVLRNLHFLDIRGIQVSQESVAELREALPNLSALEYDPTY